MQADREARRIVASLLDWNKANEHGIRVSVSGRMYRGHATERQESSSSTSNGPGGRGQ